MPITSANNALQRTVDALARGALRRGCYFAPPRAVWAMRAVAERGRYAPQLLPN
jgi:hypothetical protein